MNMLTKLLTGVLLAGFAVQAPAVADSLRIGYQNEPDPSHVAIVDGVYEKATGDKIEWRKFDSGASVIAALASNAIDIGYAGSSPLAAGVTRGAPIEAFLVAGLIGKAEGLVVRNGSGVNDIKDLVGKKVATPFVSTAHYSLLFALKQAGVDADEGECSQPAAAGDRRGVRTRRHRRGLCLGSCADQGQRERQGADRLPRRSLSLAARHSWRGSLGRTTPQRIQTSSRLSPR